jgi:tetratricopeptide (TPR) repeat protein
MALVGIGDVTKSKSVMDELNRDFPDSRYLQLISMPLVQALQDLQRNEPAKAIAALETVRPYEMGTGRYGVGFRANYIRGLAYLRLRDGVKAAAEFQRILDHQGVNPPHEQYSLSWLNLGRAYTLQGDKAKARTAYQDFFASWKDADPDVPVLLEARAEYAKLQ